MRHIPEKFVEPLLRILTEYEGYMLADKSKTKQRKATDGYYLSNIRSALSVKHVKPKKQYDNAI